MLFLIVGTIGLINIHYQWFPTLHGITVNGEMIGSIIMIGIGVLQIQTDKIINILGNK